MILTVHDELLFEAPKDAADETAAAVRQLMEVRGRAEGARHGRRRDRRELERSEELVDPATVDPSIADDRLPESS